MAEQVIGLVTSTLEEELTPRRELQDTQNAKIILGTSTKGPLEIPVRIRKEDNINDWFGDDPSPNSNEYETSLIRAYKEVMNSTVGEIDVRLMRVGDAKKASATFYENLEPVGSGIFSPTSPPIPSLIIEAVEEGSIANGIGAEFKAGTFSNDLVTGIVASNTLIITIPETFAPFAPVGTPLTFTLDPFSEDDFARFAAPEMMQNVTGETFQSSARTFASVVDLADGINAIFGPIIRARVSLLENEQDITIVANPDLSTKTTYQLTGGTYANRIRNILSMNQIKTMDDELTLGGTVGSFTYVPNKDPDGLLPTINKWYRYPKYETTILVTPNNEGATIVGLGCTKTDAWSSGFGDSLDIVQIYGKRNNTDVTALQSGIDYTIDLVTGFITVVTTSGAFFENTTGSGLKIGDAIYSTYKYLVGYNEARRRNELIIGDPTSFFIIGKDVVFGAGQPADLIANYLAYIPFDLDNIIPGTTTENATITDRRRGLYSGTISLKNIGKKQVGNVYRIKYQYEPEMPAPSGTAIDVDQDGSSSYTQPRGLTGGTDGFPKTKEEYKTALIKGYDAIDNYPFTAMIPMGAYLDDTYDGYDNETGLPAKVNARFHVDLATAIRRKSRLVKECSGYIAVRPPNKAVLTPTEERAYINRLIYTSTTDTSRPANIINAINEFRLNAVVGSPLISLDLSTTNGVKMLANPAIVYLGMKNDVPLTRSMVNIPLPAQMQEFAVKICRFDDVGALQGMRYTPMVFSVTKNAYIIADAPTLANPQSNLRRQYVLDVVILGINLVREVGDIYIGQAYSSANITAMRKNMGTKVKYMVPDILRNFHLEIIEVPDGYITGNTKVRLILTTSVEIMSVDITTQVKLGM